MKNRLDTIIEETMTVITNACININLRPVTVRLIALLLLDLPLTAPLMVDFGVDTPQQYAALQAIVRAHTKVGLAQLGKELDDALGNGRAITALVQKYAPEQGLVCFHTIWDDLRL